MKKNKKKKEHSKVIKDITHIEELNTIDFNEEDIILKAKESKTYTIIFYIKNTDYDQNETDARKNFAATINVNSVTTGTYISQQLGGGCYDITPVGDGAFKLTKFKGKDADGNPIEGCGVTKEGDYYTVTVPSVYGGQQISTLGNTLFFPADTNTLQYTKLVNVKVYNISEGITTIEDGYDVVVNLPDIELIPIGTFTSAGYNFFNSVDFVVCWN